MYNLWRIYPDIEKITFSYNYEEDTVWISVELKDGEILQSPIPRNLLVESEDKYKFILKHILDVYLEHKCVPNCVPAC